MANKQTEKVITPYERRINEPKMNKWIDEVLAEMKLKVDGKYTVGEEHEIPLDIFVHQFGRELYFKFTKDQYDKKLERLGVKQGDSAQEETNASKSSTYRKEAVDGKTMASNLMRFLEDVDDDFDEDEDDEIAMEVVGDLFEFIGKEMKKFLKPTKEEDKK